MTVAIKYGVTYGKGDSSDWLDWEIELTEEEAQAYQKAAETGADLNSVAELQAALCQ